MSTCWPRGAKVSEEESGRPGALLMQRRPFCRPGAMATWEEKGPETSCSPNLRGTRQSGERSYPKPHRPQIPTPSRCPAPLRPLNTSLCSPVSRALRTGRAGSSFILDQEGWVEGELCPPAQGSQAQPATGQRVNIWALWALAAIAARRGRSGDVNKRAGRVPGKCHYGH